MVNMVISMLLWGTTFLRYFFYLSFFNKKALWPLTNIKKVSTKNWPKFHSYIISNLILLTVFF